MRFSAATYALWAAAATCIRGAAGVASTDTYQDADAAQSGYLPNHNMDPAVVDSSSFGILWTAASYSKEQYYAKPLVFTPTLNNSNNKDALVFLASSANWIRTRNGKTGALINERQVHTPFLQSDIGCTDIPNFIGIIGTPYLDPSTETVYFFSKTYIPNYRISGNTGVPNGVYYFHAVNVNTLSDLPGYPILVDGTQADNDPRQYFIGGAILQRTSLAKVGNVVYGGFGGHCDQYNYTGTVVGVDVVQNKIVTAWATMSGPLTPTGGNITTNGAGGEGGIWQSGFGLSTDGQRLFFVTGNGNAHENNGVPASGRSGCKTLGEAVINLGISSDGSLSLSDYFQPYDYQNMDAGDQDFGSSGLALLDPTVFKGNGINKIGVTAGKNGKVYIVNADNLGGYKMGTGASPDNVIQSIQSSKAVFGGVGSYPLEGGYFYFTPVGYPTYAYKLSLDSSGKPQFVQAGTTHESSAGRVGVGYPTITTLNNQPGTAILWMTDPDAGLRAWYAVPGSDSYMKTINLPAIPGIVKFQRPSFGDTRLYTTDGNGNIYCLGSPVNLPLNCTSPVDFGNVALGSSGKVTINCTTLAATTINGAKTGDANFQVDNSTLPKGQLAKGTSFSFPVVWNLTHTSVSNQANASYGNTAPGIKSTPLTILLTADPSFAQSVPISLVGNEVSQKPFLQTAPTSVDFGTTVLSSPNDNGSDISTNYLTMTIKNAGLTNMTITGYAWTQDSDEDDDDDGPDYTNCTQNSNGVWDLGPSFTSTNLPNVGTVIGPGQSVGVTIGFLPNNGTGDYVSFFNIWSNGGTTNSILEGTASTSPIANLSISTSEGGWLDVTKNLNPVMDYGTVIAGTVSNLTLRMCNSGGSALTISKSKPPNGIFYITDEGEFHEGQQISPNTCAYATVIMGSNTEAYNTVDKQYTNSWTLNNDDYNFQIHTVEQKVTVFSKKVGPMNSTGVVYSYLGCFQDNVNGGTKLLPTIVYNGQNNSNAYCQAQCQSKGNYIFAGTEYNTECYCGNVPPPTSLQVDDSLCTYSCPADSNDRCGGAYNNGLLVAYYDSSRYHAGDNTTFGAGGLPIDPVVGNYSYVGCYTEGNGGKALLVTAAAAPTNGTTVMNCETRCAGYQYFGVEYANECYCGMAISNNATLLGNNPDTNGCNQMCKGNSSQYCGGASRLNLYNFTGVAPGPPAGSTGGGGNNGGGGGGGVALYTQPNAYNNNYAYYGCYLDNVNGRALSALVNPISGSSVSPDNCTKACAGYQYAGVEYGTECYCDNNIGGNSTVAPGGSDPTQNGCNTGCGANSSIACGGGNRLNIYSLNANSTLKRITTPSTVGSFGIWNYVGCNTEASSGRALSDSQNPIPAANVTVENCGAACANYKYFGVEYGSECYCGNTLASSSNATTGCTMVCKGNSTEYCGAGNKLNLYSKKPVTSTTAATSSTTSIATSTVATSTSTVATTTSAAATTTTVSSATSTITTVPGATTAATTSSTSSVSTILTTSTSSSSVITTTTTIATATATPTPTGPSVPSSVLNGTFAYQGCYTEATQGRALADSVNPIPGANVSIEACAKACANYTYFGTEYSNECYCGWYLRTGSAVASGGSNPSQNGCSMTCAANSLEYCGGANRLTLYKSNATGPVTNVTSLFNYTYQGCYTDNVNGRSLAASQNPIPAANVSVENCAKACKGYTYFGVEYGTECYCDNAINVNSTLVTGNNPTDTGCNVICKANSTEYCGGANRLNIYKVKSTSSKRSDGFWSGLKFLF